MSEWKGGEVAYVPVTIVNPVTYRNGKIAVTVAGECFTSWIGHVAANELLRSIPPSQPAPVNVSAISVGDEVTVRGKVVRDTESSTSEKVLVEFHGSLSGWVSERLIASHTPAQRPTTLKEFEALPLEVRERLFAEMVKGDAK